MVLSKYRSNDEGNNVKYFSRWQTRILYYKPTPYYYHYYMSEIGNTLLLSQLSVEMPLNFSYLVILGEEVETETPFR